MSICLLRVSPALSHPSPSPYTDTARHRHESMIHMPVLVFIHTRFLGIIFLDSKQYRMQHEPRPTFPFLDHASAATDLLNDLLERHVPFGVLWRCSQVRWTFDLEDVEVELCRKEGGRLEVLAHSAVLSRRRLDDFTAPCCWSTHDFGIMLLQLAEIAVGYRKDFRESRRPTRKVRGQAGMGWDAAKLTDWSQILENEHGVDLLTVNDTAKFVLGCSVSEILEELPEDFRVVHVEPVFRADLVGRFLRRRQAMKEELTTFNHSQLRECVKRKDIRSGRVVDSVEGIAEYLSEPHVTFHGAPLSRVASIVRYGFTVPGQEIGGKKSGLDKLDIRCGASFGIGIYSSPSIEVASCYAANARGQYDVRSPKDIPGMRMLICATLMGRSLQVGREETRRTEGVYREGAHSHVSPNGAEFIVFDQDQIIPCYVLHIDFGALDASKHFEEMRTNPERMEGLRNRLKPRYQTDYGDDCVFPEAVRAKKAALKAAAAKWFPYGFGPATGSTFVIEDMAPVSDDEEEYGDFQALRQEQEYEIQEKLERGEDEKVSWFDSYQTSRETYQTVRVEEEPEHRW
ncbi:uncharacterized protein MYCFIDRAFT_177498 [Pseudocercospora fijiensis CIRAD86]|uniref:PARP catalytic domain-containing protein n=1 Tax=Pseudocercospora fijiensis (strain CIRAD86) TaxID=383855 RepID=M3AST8_PSEFD|nr:uncharacterized protein MYCFIDRAFT_177498 [Pseudocercospora fijiensis CIRAD86]EME80557.1 hypothetical protein MYCFIDRAFT_177498 [Pseudocercospora fijiensis CIRAD86]